MILYHEPWLWLQTGDGINKCYGLEGEGGTVLPMTGTNLRFCFQRARPVIGVIELEETSSVTSRRGKRDEP